MTKSFYITTPIYYPSGKIAYWFSLYNDRLWRLGALQTHDELRCLLPDWSRWAWSKDPAKAEEAGITPQAYVDGMAVGVKELWQLLDISYDKFIRTTDDYHEKWWPKSLNACLLKMTSTWVSTLVGIQSLMKSSLQKANWLRSSVMRMARSSVG